MAGSGGQSSTDELEARIAELEQMVGGRHFGGSSGGGGTGGTMQSHTDTRHSDGPNSKPGHGHAKTDVTGLGDAAAKNTGTAAGTVAAGDDSRITAAASLAVAQPAGQRPGLLVPPGAYANGAAAGNTTWPASNRAYFMRFELPEAATFRYFLIFENVASGNIQCGVVKLSGAGALTYTRKMDSGVIAAPTAGNLRQDLGATLLDAGDYALFLWANNTTVQFAMSGTNGVMQATKLFAAVSSLAAGVPANGALVDWAASGDKFLTCALEADV